jgi:hypothetical protein
VHGHHDRRDGGEQARLARGERGVTRLEVCTSLHDQDIGR